MSLSWFALSFHAARPGRLFSACVSLAENRLAQVIQMRGVSQGSGLTGWPGLELQEALPPAIRVTAPSLIQAWHASEDS